MPAIEASDFTQMIDLFADLPARDHGKAASIHPSDESVLIGALLMGVSNSI